MSRNFKIWHVVPVGHELYDIAAKLKLVAKEFNHGVIDPLSLALALRQIRRCERVLGKSLARYRAGLRFRKEK